MSRGEVEAGASFERKNKPRKPNDARPGEKPGQLMKGEKGCSDPDVFRAAQKEGSRLGKSATQPATVKNLGTAENKIGANQDPKMRA